MTLRIAARHADEWNVWGTPATLRHKMAILDGHCAKVGRDPRTIQRSAVALLFMSNDAAFIERMRARPSQQAAIIGSVAEVRATVEEYRAAVEGAGVGFAAMRPSLSELGDYQATVTRIFDVRRGPIA